MTADEIRAFLQQYVKAWERQDCSTLASWYAEDCQVESPMFGTIRGRAAVEASLKDVFRMFTDLKFEIEEILIDRDQGDKAALLCRSLETHQGEAFGMPGTGRRVENRLVFMFRFKDGHIAGETRLYDFTGLLLQLGVLKARTA